MIRPLTPATAWPKTFVGPALLGVVIVAVTGQYAPFFWVTLLTQSAVYAIAVLGLNVLIGYTGQVSFAHNVFFGIGAYATAMGTTRWHLAPLVALVVGALAAVAVALVIGVPVLRLRGYYLAMATFALGLAFYAFIGNAPWFNGFTGIAAIPPFRVGGLSVQGPVAQYWFSCAVLLVAIIAAWRLRAFRFGRAALTLAEDEAVAESVGINPLRYKLTAFALSAVFAAVAGSLFAHNTSFVSPESFSFTTAITFFVMLFIGGLRGVWGVVIGAFAVIALPEVFTGLQDIEPTLLSVALIVILIFRPSGLLAPLDELPRLRFLEARASAKGVVT